MPSTTPKVVRRWALRTLVVTGPLTVITFAAWLVWPHLLQPNDIQLGTDVVFALYQFLGMVSLSAGVVASLAHGQAATARAFSAGYNAGLAVAEAAEDVAGVQVPDEHRPTRLRMVD